MKNSTRRFLKATFVVSLTACLCSCASVRQRTSATATIDVCGVITCNGKAADDYSVRVDRANVTRTEDGYYRLDGISRNLKRIYIRRSGSSKPRYYPRIALPETDTVLNYEIVPYYAADHGPFHYDLRLHRSWGNSLDDPFDTASVNGFLENTHTLSGLVLKPVHGVAVIAEAIWTIPGFAIGMGVGSVPKIRGKEFNLFGLTGTLLAGYLPIEATVKVIEVPIKTLLWPIDRLVAWPTRRKLNKIRSTVLDQHNQENRNKTAGADTE